MPTARQSRLRGCALGVALAALVPIAGGLWWVVSSRSAARQAEQVQADAAQEFFAPALEKLDEGIADPGYDIDKTIRVVHQIDQALAHQDDLPAYLEAVALQDYRDVAPDVLEARRALLDVLLQLYAKQVEADDQQALWEITSELMLATLSVVQVSGEANLVTPAGSMSVDRAQAQALLTDLKSRQAEHKQLVKDITHLERELHEALVDYSEVYFTYVEEWDSLSILRDRAYLAARNGDWEETQASAELAIAKAPHEREAHLLAALAMIESGEPERLEAAGDLLEDYLTDHPDASAPALLLTGVLHQRLGDEKRAMLAFQQSAAYYPKQADQLSDMLDPYKMRSYLRHSREGSFIVELYRSTMLGAGYFSPDLQMARMLFDRGEDDKASAKVLDHFARRRAQEQWDFVLSDIQFCHDVLGPHFWEIFPEDTYLDLQVSPPMLGTGLNLAVQNRSPRTLHNATLVLALHFTDTYPEDYEALAIQPSLPAVIAGEITDFGHTEIAIDLSGTVKTEADIVHHRAILVSDEAVVWVDTDAYRIAEAEAFRDKERSRAATQSAPPSDRSTRHPEFRSTADRLVEQASAAVQLEVESRYGVDDVLVELPRELAILRPLFQLRHGDTVFEASDNRIEGGHIALRFAGVHNFDDAPGDDLELVMASPFGDVVFGWTPGEDLRWRYEGLAPSP